MALNEPDQGTVPPRLEVDSLIHSYGRDPVLAGVYFTCEPGEVVGIVGRNGCGKTTMIKCLLGLIQPESMHLSVDGEIVKCGFASGHFGCLSQDPFLPRRISVRKAVRLFLPDNASRTAVLEDPRIAPLSGRRIARLSGGEHRYLEVLLVTRLPAPYLLLDEPFTEIEPVHRGPVKQLIRTTAQKRGVVVTDHAYHDILEVSDRVVVLSDGVLRNVESEEDLTRWGYTP